jgi:hypothetical protein
MKCPHCMNRLGFWKGIDYAGGLTKPLHCPHCKKKIAEAPRISYVILVSIPVLVFAFILDPWLWDGPFGRHAKYLLGVNYMLQFVIVLGIALLCCALLASRLLDMNVDGHQPTSPKTDQKGR